MVTKTKIVYTCQACGTAYPKWIGRCEDCGAWNTLVEEPIKSQTSKFSGYLDESSKNTSWLTEISFDQEPRLATEIEELDRVLGGGLVTGSSVLIGGNPGIGKSTLLLQTLSNLSKQHKVLYITGEESLPQIALRANRLGLSKSKLLLIAQTQTEKVIEQIITEAPTIVAIDSIQTMYTEDLNSAPGGASQIKECTAKLVRLAKQTKTAIFIVGHVTKEGTLAGPKVLEHMVDCVLYFEGESDHRLRIIRATKNRYGAVNELGIFAMTDRGLKEITNPSAIFLATHNTNKPGSAIMAAWEGSRPLLVELQALVDDSYLTNPRRITLGLESNRLAMLLAVLHRHGGVNSHQQDVFINIVGGLKIAETAADLPLLLAVVSSIRNRPLPDKLAVFGEVGLAGEIRPVSAGQERIKAAAKHGFKKIIVPSANLPANKSSLALEVIGVSSVSEALQAIK